MFSIFHGLFTLFAIGVNNINNNMSDDKLRNLAKEDGSMVYYSSNGVRWAENGRLVTQRYIGNNLCWIDSKDGTIYCNLTDKKNQEHNKTTKEYAIESGRDTYENIEEFKVYAKGTRLLFTKEIDIETGMPVKEITINKVNFWMNLKDGKLLKITHNSKGYYNNDTIITGIVSKYYKFNIPYTPKDIIRIFNQRQEQLQNHPLYNKDQKWMKNVYYLHPDDEKTQITMDEVGRVIFKNHNNEKNQEQRNEGLPKIIELRDIYYNSNSVLKDILER